jgi:putative ABC transport system permease protein
MLSIVIGMTACLLTHGFFNWNSSMLKESMIRGGIGHFQLFTKGFSKSGSDDPYNYLIKDAGPVINELRRIPGVEIVTARMAYNGILASGEKSSVTMGEAGNPDIESRLNAYQGIIDGTNLSSSIPGGIILGEGLAKKLSAKIGDTLTLMGNMKGGGINASDFTVAGITRSGFADLDNMSSTAGIGAIQGLLNLDQSVQKIVVLLKNTGDTPKILPKIAEISVRYNLEFKVWDSIAEFYQSVKLMYDAVFTIIIIIVLGIVTFTISNTVNMNLYDRFREIGTIRALGTKRSQVALIFISESFLTGF